MPRAGSSGWTATPDMPGTHSASKQYRYCVASARAWKPLHTPAGTSTCVPITSGTVTTAPRVGEDARVST